MDYTENIDQFHGKVQLQGGQALEAFDQDFIDEAAAREWFLAVLHPGGPACPWCGEPVEAQACRRWWAGQVLRCHACGSKFSGRSGTILAKVRLSYSAALAFLLFQDLGFSVRDISRRLGLRIRTAYEYKNRFSGEGS